MTSTVIGVVIVTRHGDRQGFYQDPKSYTASDTTITPLGSLQEYQSGVGMRARYLDASSPYHIQGIASGAPNLAQVNFIADSAEGQVIVDSAYAFSQGLFPANQTASTIELANGTSVTSPLGGYVYVPIQSIETSQDIDLEGFSDCPAFAAHTSAVYASSEFQDVATANQQYLSGLSPLLDGRSVSLANAYNIFDYMNVNNIHNKTFASQVSSQEMQQALALANYHEQSVFTGPQPDSIGNIAGQTFLRPILSALESFKASNTSTSDALKLQYIGIAYKPFLSFFNMTSVQDALPGMVGYASAMALEVHNSSGTLNIVMNFRNGTPTALDGSDLQTYPLFGSSSSSTPLQTFIDNLAPHAINDLGEWCNRCNNTATRGCDVIALANSTVSSQGASGEYASATSTTGRHHVSPVVAGVIGALVALAFAAVLFALSEWSRRRNASKRQVYMGQRIGQAYREDSVASSGYELTAPDQKVPSDL